MDAHAASCTLAVISQTGRRLRDFPVETNGQALVEAVRMIPGHKHLVFEEGLRSAWLHGTLRPHMDEIVVTGITQSRDPKDVYSPRHRGERQKQLSSNAQTRATRLYDHLDFLLEQKKQAEAGLLREAKKHPIVRILETAPGFGPIRAARLVPIVVTPHCFRTQRQFWSYCGLGIVTRSSSNWVQTADGGWIKARVPQTRGLSRQHNRALKHIFKSAATTLITQRNKDPIHARYERLLGGGTKPTRAKLRLARMIAATVLRMWKDEGEYDPGRSGRSTHTREG